MVYSLVKGYRFETLGKSVSEFGSLSIVGIGSLLSFEFGWY